MAATSVKHEIKDVDPIVNPLKRKNNISGANKRPKKAKIGNNSLFKKRISFFICVCVFVMQMLWINANPYWVML